MISISFVLVVFALIMLRFIIIKYGAALQPEMNNAYPVFYKSGYFFSFNSNNTKLNMILFLHNIWEMWNKIINLTMSTFGSDEGLLLSTLLSKSILRWILDAEKKVKSIIFCKECVTFDHSYSNYASRKQDSLFLDFCLRL